MTGFGEARLQDPRWTIVVEVRTVNNRHFKLSAKISESYAMIEPALEQLVREKVRRGTVQFSLRVERPRRPEDYRFNLVALASYRDQLKGLRVSTSGRSTCRRSCRLPGVVEDSSSRASKLRPKIGPRSRGRQSRRCEARSQPRQEGKAMAAELIALGRGIRDQLSAIAERGPHVVQIPTSGSASAFRHWCKTGVTVEPKDLTGRSRSWPIDATSAEEIVRLRAHLTQFIAIIDEPQSAGRKLEFVSPGDRPRDQHDRLEGRRRADQPRGGRGEGASGKDSRAGPKCRMKVTIGQTCRGG